ncbi:MAG: ThuA domain-containing protein [Clostridia bacterium]|nr:ThuA domain-containing protein [Clostridia bacterium]
MKVLVWNEFLHERTDERVRKIYPDGIHNTISEFLSKESDLEVTTATLDDPECGITEEVLANTDVLIWWGHMAHKKVPEEVANRIRDAVLKGMGFIALHSAHHSKPFRYLMGTSCNLTWRENGDSERIWVVDPANPIAQGLGRYFELPHEEAYGEYFDIPQPDRLVFIGHYDGGEVFRSGCCFQRGYGKIFYFQPGHETYPTYYIPEVQTVIKNAVRWAAPVQRITELKAPRVEPVIPVTEE